MGGRGESIYSGLSVKQRANIITIRCYWAGDCTSGRATVEVGLMCCSSQQSPAPGTKVSGGQWWLELETGI